MLSLSRLAVVLAAGPAIFLAAALPSQAQSRSDGIAESDVVGGTLSKPGAFPFIVALSYKGVQLCGGVLLNAHTVLTAAHCTPGPADHVSPSLFGVHAGSLAWNTGGIQTGVSRWLIHPEFDPDVSLNNDVCLWHLSTPIYPSSTISYATLPARAFDPPAGALLNFAGWGVTNNTLNDSPKYLHEITYPVGSHAECIARFSESHQYNTTTMFCAGSKQGGKDACEGDSGGPGVGQRSRVVWGISTWGPDDCGDVDSFSVYAQLGFYADWIQRSMFVQ